MYLAAVCDFLKQVDELKTGEMLLDTFSKYAVHLQQLDEIAMLYERMKCYKKSLDTLHKCAAIANEQQMYSIRSNLAKVLNHYNDPEQSKKYSEINLEINATDYDAVMEISFSYYLLGEKEKSYELQKELLDKNIDVELKKRIMYNMGTFYMERGRFKEGIKNMIMGGRGIGIWPPLKKPYPKWDGEDKSKTLIVYAESGIGDNIINLRFMNILKNRGIDAIWISGREDLTTLFKNNEYNVIDNKVSLDPFKEYCYIEAMSLPIYLDLDIHELWNGPYLKPSQEYIEKWKAKLPPNFLTLRWSGNPYYDQDLHRFIDRKPLVDGFSKFNLPLVSLQIDKKGEDERLIDVDIEDWRDTVAIQYLAKFNITSCTSTAHSAAAMDVKTVILPPIATYYTWVPLRGENRSHWYGDNVALYPQTKHKSWDEPIEQAMKYVVQNI